MKLVNGLPVTAFLGFKESFKITRLLRLVGAEAFQSCTVF